MIGEPPIRFGSSSSVDSILYDSVLVGKTPLFWLDTRHGMEEWLNLPNKN